MTGGGLSLKVISRHLTYTVEWVDLTSEREKSTVLNLYICLIGWVDSQREKNNIVFESLSPIGCVDSHTQKHDVFELSIGIDFRIFA